MLDIRSKTIRERLHLSSSMVVDVKDLRIHNIAGVAADLADEWPDLMYTTCKDTSGRTIIARIAVGEAAKEIKRKGTKLKNMLQDI